MTPQRYRRVSTILQMLVGAGCGAAVVAKNYAVFIIIVLAASAILLILRKRTEGIPADERDRETGGRAALVAMLSFAYTALAAACILFIFQDDDPSYPVIAATLAYSACVLMIVYSFIFSYLDRYRFSRRGWLYLTFAAGLTLIVVVASLKLFSGGDDWICRGGKWIMHGHPSFPAPSRPCN